MVVWTSSLFRMHLFLYKACKQLASESRRAMLKAGLIQYSEPCAYCAWYGAALQQVSNVSLSSTIYTTMERT